MGYKGVLWVVREVRQNRLLTLFDLYTTSYGSQESTYGLYGVWVQGSRL